MRSDGTSHHILIVDDEVDLRRVLEMSFELEGYHVQTAENGSVALEILRKNPAISLVISDVRMPNGDGPALLAAIREAGIQIPLIFMTGYADLTNEKARSLGAAMLISKPFSFAELFAAVREVLG